MAIPSGPLKCVVAVGYVDDGKINWMASGFIYARRKKNGHRDVFLVTNKHVIEGFGELVMRMEGSAGNPPADVRVHVTPAGDSPYWLGHPDQDVDIAVTRIRPAVLKNEALGADAASESTAALSHQLQEAGFGEGDPVSVLGFPMGLVDERLHLAIVRKGAVARCRDVYEGTSNAYILDVTLFPGNSGGPVFARLPVKRPGEKEPSDMSVLVGIVTRYLPYQDVAYSTLTNQPRVMFEENSGLALAHPMDLVNETIDAYWTFKDKAKAAKTSKAARTGEKSQRATAATAKPS